MENILANQAHSAIEHDLEERVIIREEEKKRLSGEREDLSPREEGEIATARNRRMLGNDLFSPAAAKRQVD